MPERLVKKQMVCSEGNSYHDCRFILGSATEIEGVFSVANRILANGRHAMTPQVLEAFIFLKYNARCWDAEQ